MLLERFDIYGCIVRFIESFFHDIQGFPGDFFSVHNGFPFFEVCADECCSAAFLIFTVDCRQSIWLRRPVHCFRRFGRQQLLLPAGRFGYFSISESRGQGGDENWGRRKRWEIEAAD